MLLYFSEQIPVTGKNNWQQAVAEISDSLTRNIINNIVLSKGEKPVIILWTLSENTVRFQL